MRDNVRFVDGVHKEFKGPFLELFKAVKMSKVVGGFHITRRNTVARRHHFDGASGQIDSIGVDIVNNGVKNLNCIIVEDKNSG
jgi:hypothetical protein